MKILILSVESNNYSTIRLVEEIEKKREEYEVIHPRDLYAYISSTVSGHDRVYRRTEGKSERILKKEFDAIIPRVSGEAFEHAVMITKQFNENMRIFSTGTEPGLRICSNKLNTCQVLSANKIRVPKQILAYKPSDYKELIDLVGGLPCIAKLQKGSLGDGVMILNDELAASTSLKSFEKLGANVILQQFINSGEPKNDLRIFIVGAEKKEPLIFAYKRFALDNDFRSNYTKSQLGQRVEITKEEKQMAIEAARILNLGVCGVDIMRDIEDDNKPYVIEVNGNPGLKGVEKVTGENIAGAIIDYVMDNYKKGGKPLSMSKFPAITISEEDVNFFERHSGFYFQKHFKVFKHLSEGGIVQLFPKSSYRQIKIKEE